jgi:hypothetical protein
VTTTRREWPNAALDARDRAAEGAVEAIRALEPLVLRYADLTESEKIRRAAVGLNACQRIARLLESVGACTRP